MKNYIFLFVLSLSFNLKAFSIDSDNSIIFQSLDPESIVSCDTLPNSILSNCELDGCVDWYKSVAERFFGLPNEDECIQWYGSNNLEGTVYTNNKVILGTTIIPINNYKFVSVNPIKTEKFYVCIDSWCDFVFRPDYNLNSIRDLKNEISESKVISSLKHPELDNTGYSLDEVILFQQQKIEELYLHLIRLNEELIELENN